MELFLLRHGIAAEHGDPRYKKDSDRPLTDEGIEKMEAVALAMKKMDLVFDTVLCSPYVRTRETAEIVVRKLDLGKQLHFTENLISEANPRKLTEEINKHYPRSQSMLLVGHEPFLSNMISQLVTGSETSLFTMKKGGLCKLTVSGSLVYKQCAVFEWMITPKQMGRIGRL